LPTDLGGDEYVLPLDDAFGNLLPNRRTHFGLISVEVGGVYVPVAHINRVQNCPFAITFRRLKSQVINNVSGSSNDVNPATDRRHS